MIEVHLETTLFCPHDCIHCSGYANSTNQHLAYDVIKSRLIKLKSIKEDIAQIVITGGEPLSRNDLGIIILDSKQIVQNIGLFTTGHDGCGYVSRERWLELSKSGLTSSVFSVHSIEDRINSFIFGSSILKDTLESIKNANRAGLLTEINCIISKKNYHSIERTIDVLIEEYKVNRVRLLRLVLQGRAKDHKDELLLESDKLIEFITFLKSKFGDKVHFEGFPSIHKCRSNSNIGKGCQFGKGFLYIDTNGTILPCPAVKQNSESILGNIDTIQDLKSISSNIVPINPNYDYFKCLSQASWIKGEL